MRFPTSLILVLNASACTVVESDFGETFSAHSIDTLVADVDQGDVTVDGILGQSTFTVTGRTFGYSVSSDNAQRNEDANTWSVGIEGNQLNLWGQSEYLGAGVDFEVMGPKAVDTSLIAESGQIEISNVAGNHYLEGHGVTVDDLTGSATIIAGRSGVNGSLVPLTGDIIYIESEDDVRLRLPYGLDYDLQVWGDPEYEMEIHDLGFTQTAHAPAYFAGYSGRGTTTIDIVVTGGNVTIYDSWY